MDEKKIKEILLTMTNEIYKTIRLLADENKKLEQRVEDLEQKLGKYEKER